MRYFCNMALAIGCVLVTAVDTMELRAADLNIVAAKANAIVVGRLTTRNEGDSAVTFNLSVDKVLKGSDVPTVIGVSHTWTRKGVFLGDLAGVRQVDAPCRGIWFLQRKELSEWDVLPVQGPDGIFTSLYFPAAEIASGDYLPADAPWRDVVGVAIVAGAKANPQNAAEILGFLQNYDSAATAEAIKNLGDSNNSRIRLAAQIGSLAKGNPEAAMWARNAWASLDSPTKELLASTIEHSYRTATAPSIQQLVALATLDAAQTDIRRAAVTALAAIHTKDALPFLAALLESSDSWEQMKGVYGLSSFANGCPVQTPDNTASMAYLQCSQPSEYRTAQTQSHFGFRRGSSREEAELVVFWQQWWDVNKFSLTALGESAGSTIK